MITGVKQVQKRFKTGVKLVYGGADVRLLLQRAAGDGVKRV